MFCAGLYTLRQRGRATLDITLQTHQGLRIGQIQEIARERTARERQLANLRS